jgi:hypothetical protein
MKKIFALLAVVMMTATVSAQHEIGAIVGGLNGASYKYWFNDNLALQADLAVGLTQAAGGADYGYGYQSWNAPFFDLTINPNVLYHWGLPANFKIYAGGGINFGMVSDLRNVSYGTDAISGKFGINAACGVTYDIQAVPLVLAFDFRPGYGLGFREANAPTTSYFDWKIAFAVRYRL